MCTVCMKIQKANVFITNPKVCGMLFSTRIGTYIKGSHIGLVYVMMPTALVRCNVTNACTSLRGREYIAR